ncbi:hypothetical protein IJ670_01665, partial [bacterium]|nr:hypothetical protein [bacterium]
MKVSFVAQKHCVDLPYSPKNVKVQTKEQKYSDFIPKSGIYLTFGANPLKNLSQVASIAPEYQGIMNSVYKIGGLGNVAGEASVAFNDFGNMDFRTFVPYYSPDNLNGGIKVKKPLLDAEGKQIMWQKPKYLGSTPMIKDGKQVFEEIPAFQFVQEPVNYVLKEGEDFVIHEPVQKGKEWMTGYKVLHDTGIKGEVETIGDDLASLTKTPYKVFSVAGTEPLKQGNPAVYIVHTPELAKFPKAYGGDYAYIGKTFDDAYYSIFSKATIDAMPSLNNEKFGNFNPGNFWLHDRQAFDSLVEISEKSSKGDNYWKGIRVHSSYHNPGRDYQGHYKNPIDFMRITGSKTDLE